MKKFWIAILFAIPLSGCESLGLGGVYSTPSRGAGDGSVEEGGDADPPTGGVADTAEAPSTTLLRQGRAQLAIGDYSSAAATLERAVRIEPDNPWPWLELANVYLVSGDLRQAQSHANRALSLAGSDQDARRAAERMLADISRRQD